MNVYNIQVRRDANTITPVQVPEHEIPILQTVFGTENVQTIGGKRVDETELTAADLAGEMTLDPTGEFDRLSSKYGANEEGPVIDQVYGKKAARGLDLRIKENLAKEAEEAAAAEKKPSKKDKPAEQEAAK